ncbi:MAG: AAA family ATPase [Lachnospiraceae bacterium]|nr:AAA family ATPase [Lachnospiraceae bacterium]
MKSISTSISTFKNIIRSGYLYVDKTRYIYEMVKEPFGQFFFSRPRRFGKSLTISTLEAVFEGEKELFKGLFIENTNYTWEKYPIIHIDFGRSDSLTVANLEEWLKLEMTSIAGRHDVQIGGSTPALMFGELIKALYYKYDKGVVILVDEYDRPITNNLEDGKGVKKISRTMEAFYQMIKGYEAMERFVFITGITRLSQVSVFSKLNNLVDISRSEKYADAVGYTAEELADNFDEGIRAAAQKKGYSTDGLLAELALWYDGFRFSFEGNKVYNPVSIGRFFTENYEFRNYWYATAIPVILVNYAKKQKITLELIQNAIITDISFNSFDIMALSENDVDTQTIIQLLLQTGYLTIGERDEKNNLRAYKLVYPNKEVQLSFETDLTSVYTGKSISEINVVASGVQKAAYGGDTDQLIVILQSIFAGIPYAIQLKYEKYYQSLLYLMFKMCGMDVSAESMTNIGRIDAVLEAGKNIYVIECKIDRTAKEAMQQIDDKKYIEKYYDKIENGYHVIKIGMNFSSDKSVRNINEYLVGFIDE